MKQAEEDALEVYEKKNNINLPWHFESTNIQCGHMYVRLDDFDPKLHHIGGHKHEFIDEEIMLFDENKGSAAAGADALVGAGSVGLAGMFGNVSRSMAMDPSVMLKSQDARTLVQRFTQNHGASPLMGRSSVGSLISDISLASRVSTMSAAQRYGCDPAASKVFFGPTYSPLAVLSAPLTVNSRIECNSNHDTLAAFFKFHVGNNFGGLSQQQKKFFVNGFKKLLKEHYNLRHRRQSLFTSAMSDLQGAGFTNSATTTDPGQSTMMDQARMTSVISETADPAAACFVEQLIEDLGINSDIEALIKSPGDVDLKLPKMLWINRLLQSARRPQDLNEQKNKNLDEIAQGELKHKHETSTVLARRFVRMQSSMSRFGNQQLLHNAEDVRYVQLCTINAKAKLGFFPLPIGHENYHRPAKDAPKQEKKTGAFLAMFGVKKKEKTFSLSYLSIAVLHYHICQRFNHMPDLDFHADKSAKKRKAAAGAKATKQAATKAKATGIWNKLKIAVATEKEEKEKRGGDEDEKDPNSPVGGLGFLSASGMSNYGVNLNLTLEYIVELVMELQKRLRNTPEGEKLDKLLKQAGHGQNSPPSAEFMKQLSDYIMYILTNYVMSSPPKCVADDRAKEAEEAAAKSSKHDGSKVEIPEMSKLASAPTVAAASTGVKNNKKTAQIHKDHHDEETSDDENNKENRKDRHLSTSEEVDYVLLPTPPSITALKYVLDAHVKRDHMVLLGHQGGPEVQSLEATGLGEDLFGSVGGDSMQGTNLSTGSNVSRLSGSLHVSKNEFGAKHLSHMQGGATESRARANISRRKELAANAGFNPYQMDNNNLSNNSIGVQMRLIEHEYEYQSTDEEHSDDDMMANTTAVEQNSPMDDAAFGVEENVK